MKTCFLGVLKVSEIGMGRMGLFMAVGMYQKKGFLICLFPSIANDDSLLTKAGCKRYTGN